MIKEPPAEGLTLSFSSTSISGRLRRAKTSVDAMTPSRERDVLLKALENVEGHLELQSNPPRTPHQLLGDHPLAVYLRSSQRMPTVEEKNLKSIADSPSIESILELLSIAANDGQQSPHLAAAALAKVIGHAKAIGDVATEAKLRYELTQNYPQTYHAKRSER